MKKKSMKDYALEYAESGFAISPLKYKTKDVFLSKHGFNDATTDLKQVNEWWTLHPNANIIIATGSKSNLLIIDLDTDKDAGVSGYETLREWEIENGELPETVTAISGGGGYHLYYKYNPEKNIKSTTGLFFKQSGIDIRCEGGAIIAPPSLHPNGNRYVFECNSWEVGYQEATDLVYKFISEGMKNKEDLSRRSYKSNSTGNRFVLPEIIHEGERDITMYRFACSCLARGLDETKTYNLMMRVNLENCQPPMPDKQIETKLKSALKTRRKQGVTR